MRWTGSRLRSNRLPHLAVPALSCRGSPISGWTPVPSSKGLRQDAVPPIGFDEFDDQGIGAQHLGVEPQHVGPRLAFETDCFGLALRVEDRRLAVGIGNLELCFGLAVRARDRLLRLEADAVDRVLRFASLAEMPACQFGLRIS